MSVSGIEWAGTPFLCLHHRDGRMVREPGVYGFARRGPGDERVLLFVDQADCIAAVAGPGNPFWEQALGLGMNELHVCLRARERIDRLLLRGHLIRRVGPILNLLDGQDAAAAEPGLVALRGGRRG